MIIDVSNRQRKYKVNQRLIRDKVKAILSLCGLKDVELSILIVNNRKIKVLNKIYRGIDRPTDVLAFTMNENNPPSPPLEKGGISPPFLKGDLGGLVIQPRLLGDIVISMEKAYNQAEEHGHSPTREFLILLTHGLLHLIGYDHERSPSEERRMRRKEDFILQRVQGGNPLTP